jgi:hypothetical protein
VFAKGVQEKTKAAAEAANEKAKAVT